jgi:hippurate hydrolase
VFGRAWKVPYVFWFVGCTDPQIYAQAKAKGAINSIASNHSPKFAPLLHPTLRTGLETMLCAAFAWFANAE